MLSARRKSDGQTVTAYFEKKTNGPFVCLQCHEEVILKSGRNRVSHFAHANPIACKFAEGESELHRKCKMEIYEALRKSPGVRDAALEGPRGENRPDVSAYINGVPVTLHPEREGRILQAGLARKHGGGQAAACELGQNDAALLLGSSHSPFGVQGHRQLRDHGRSHRRGNIRTTRSYHSSQNYDIYQKLTRGAPRDAYHSRLESNLVMPLVSRKLEIGDVLN